MQAWERRWFLERTWSTTKSRVLDGSEKYRGGRGLFQGDFCAARVEFSVARPFGQGFGRAIFTITVSGMGVLFRLPRVALSVPSGGMTVSRGCWDGPAVRGLSNGRAAAHPEITTGDSERQRQREDAQTRDGALSVRVSRTFTAFCVLFRGLICSAKDAHGLI